MLRCGLLGEKLGHSYSPAIHEMLADYDYRLYECKPEELESFVKSGEWDGLNVTIPYKKAVIPFCDELSETAARIGSVNTLVRRADGSIFGDNTDAYGFESMVRRSGVDAHGKKALVLGSGGASVTVCAVLKALGAEATVISRSGENNYKNLSRHSDARIIVNTTPVGMYPNNGASPLDLAFFPECEAVLDIVYNPARTQLLLQAEKLGIAHAGGLHMLVAQAKRSAEQFTKQDIPDSEIDRIEKELSRSMQNIVLVGMPGCGKSTVARLLGEALERPVYEADELVERKERRSITDIFAANGEGFFRRKETEILSELGKLSGAVISTGGGCVTREENYPLLHQNGVIIWIRREIGSLAKQGRPISLKTDLGELYAQRKDKYAAFADLVCDNNDTPEQTVSDILEMLK